PPDGAGKGRDVRGAAREAGRAADAPEPEEGEPLQVAPQVEAVGEPGIDRRDRQTARRHERQHVEIARGESGAVEGVADGRLRQVGRMPDEEVVGGGERARNDVVVDGERQVPLLDSHRPVEPLDRVDARATLAPQRREGPGCHRLLAASGGGSRPHGEKIHGRSFYPDRDDARNGRRPGSVGTILLDSLPASDYRQGNGGHGGVFSRLLLGLLRDGHARHGYELITSYRTRSGLRTNPGNFYRE